MKDRKCKSHNCSGLAGPSTPSAFGGGSSGGLPLTSAIPRNRRTFSGSGQTISQFTRDRLKTMIATKKQRLYSSCSTGSSANIGIYFILPSSSRRLLTNVQNMIAGSGVGWLPPSNSELSFFGASGGVVVPSSLSSASNHFEPYPQFSHRTTTADGYGGAHAPHSAAPTAKPSVVAEPTELPSDYQLRKVNSEPNLKMRIRARYYFRGFNFCMTCITNFFIHIGC